MRLLLVLLALSHASFAQVAGAPLTGKVVKVVDGDTFDLLANKTTHRIRLDAIDAPESKQAFGESSRKALANLIAGKQVSVNWQKRDRFKRIIGQVKRDGVNVNLEQVKIGMAWHYTQFNKDAKYDQAQKSAKENHLGLWNDPNPVPPWTFRKNK